MSSDPAPSCGVGLPAPFLSSLSALRGARVLVTGGCGFLGGHIVQVLLQAGAKVRVFDVVPPRDNHGIWKKDDPVEVLTGNLLNAGEVSAALSGCWCVIHVASPAPTSRNAALFQSVNVDGTRVLLDACKAQGVQRFVYTSSASVVFDGRDQRNLDETAPPPMAAMDDYTKSKLAAEQLVLKANNGSDLFTTAIRPHGIFGARDPHFLPVLAQTGAKGKSKFLIGDGANLVDFTYVENVAYAHALAAVQLGAGAKVNGQAYFITNREPLFFWEMITRLHRSWGYTLPWIQMPVVLMRPMAVVLEAIGEVAGFRPTFTTQAINYSGCAHYYSSAKAGRDMGYNPPIDMDEAIKRSLNHYWELRNKQPAAVLARIAKTKTQASKGNTVPPQRLLGFTSTPLFKIMLGLTALILLLSSAGFKKSLFLVLVSLIAYFVSLYRDSFGVVAAMYKRIGSAPVTAEELNKTILITGANRGLGFHTAQEFLELGYAPKSAGTGATLILTCRDLSKGQAALESLRSKYPAQNIEMMELDLARFASISALVSELKKKKSAGGVKLPIDILIHNAGAMVDASLTADGLDNQFQSNFLAHVQLTNLLLKEGNALLASNARLINVSSMMHRLVANFFPLSFEDLMDTKDKSRKKYSKLGMYCRTKLLQIMWASKLQRVFNAEVNQLRLKQPVSKDLGLMGRRTIVSVNPGAVATEFIHHFIPAALASAIEPLLMALVEKTPKQGVQAIVYAALSQEMENVGGVYVDNCVVCLPSGVAGNEEYQEFVYKRCEEIIASAK